MAYDKKKILQSAKDLIQGDDSIYFIEDVTALLPISKTTFYDFFQVDSDELNDLKELLDTNRVNVKKAMRKKWEKSDNPTLQVALMKIISTDEESSRLSGTKHTIDVKGDITYDGILNQVLPPDAE